jgi:hypothetical protein
MNKHLLQSLESLGYSGLREIGGDIIGLYDYLTTRAIVVGLNEFGYERRYCYQDREEATSSLEIWDGKGHPPGNWIKVKGRGIDELNPLWVHS